jgi:nucleoside-diphosphate-sugar epimerase
MTKILITGISGFIGRNVLRQILQKKGLEITGLIRPGTNLSRVEEFEHQINLVEIDLEDINKLKAYLVNAEFDKIIHIGALRGGRKNTKNAYFDANVNATEQLALFALEKEAEFIFCSSVGVFGAIPVELPANNFTKRQEDNYYHFTKIRAESIIQKLVLYGLKAAIIRPAITYGIGDYGFPFTLIKLTDKKLMFIPDRDVMIHLTNVELLANAFFQLLEKGFEPGTAYNIADKEPVKLTKLVDLINNELKGKDYLKNRTIDYRWFDLATSLAKKLKNELWISRFELISKSWYYDTTPAERDLGLKSMNTFHAFPTIINWYKSSN